jgi:hypothetical protein
MSAYTQYVPAPDPHDPDPLDQPGNGGSLGRVLLCGFLGVLLLLGVAGWFTWRWVDQNLLHWGLADGPTQTINESELLRRVQAFELTTVKQTYASHSEIDVSQKLNLGPKSVGLPSFLAGQRLKAKGQATITAGVDLSRVKPEDMQVTRDGKNVQVALTLPPPQVLSSALEPGTLDLSTSSGMLNRFGQAVGLNEQDLRDRAADEVTLAAREQALEQGILLDAAQEAGRRMQAFLQSLPQTGSERVTYVVTVRPAAGAQ